MAQKAKSRRPGAGRGAAAPPQNNAANGSTNGFHKTEAPPPLLGENHPLASAMGAFKDDPFWDDFIQIMKDARREEDERYFQSIPGVAAEDWSA